MCTPPRAASSAAPQQRASTRGIRKSNGRAALADANTISDDDQLQLLWLELKSAFPRLRAAHVSKPLLLAAEQAVKQELGRPRTGVLPRAEHLALQALLPPGGRVEKLRVWTSHLHNLAAVRASAAAVAEQAATRDTSLGPRRPTLSQLASFCWTLGESATTLGPEQPRPVVWELVPTRAIGAGLKSPKSALRTLLKLAPSAAARNMVAGTEWRNVGTRDPPDYVRLHITTDMVEEARKVLLCCLGSREVASLAPPPDLRIATETRALPSGEGSLQAWLSFGESMSALHRDPPHGVLVCLSGTKAVGLLPPGAPSLCGIGATQSMGVNKFSRDYNVLADSERFDEGGMFAGVRQVATLRRGQALFIPRGWWHQVHTTAGGVALSVPVRVV